MISTLNPVTMGGNPPLREYVALAEKYGFGGIDLNLGEVIMAEQESSWGAVNALFEQYEVAPGTGGLPIDCFGEQAAFDAGMVELGKHAKAAQKIGCKSFCTWIRPAVDGEPEAFRAQCVKRFRQVGMLLGDHGLRFGVEFVGTPTLRSGPRSMGKNEFIHTLPQTLDLIDEIDAPAGNVGLLIDSFHWFCTGSSREELIGLTSKQVVHVHVNDAPDKPVEEQIDNQRLLPGEGIIDLDLFLVSLRKAGYNGFAGVETFSDELTALGFDGAAQKASVAMGRLFDR